MTDNNVIDFPRIGFTLTPQPAPDAAVIEPPNTPTPDLGTGPATGRRSPLDIVSALPDPGIIQPVLTTPVGPQPGHVPAAFRNEPAGDMVGPRLGALSMAATLAVAVAALRGTHTVLSTWWQNRLARQAETDKLREARLKHQLAMQNIGDKATQQRAKQSSKVPSSSEFGRKTLGNRSAGGQGAGKGPGRKGSGATGSGSPSGLGSKNGSGPSRGPKRSNTGTGSDRGPASGGKGSQRRNKASLNNRPGGASKNNGSLRKNSDGPSKRKPLGSGDGAGSGKKNHGSRDGSSRKTLTQAAGKQMTKAAARRLKRRRKNLESPAVWSDNKNRPDRKRKNGKGPSADTKTPTEQRPQLEAGKDTRRKNNASRKDRKRADRTTLAGSMGRGAYQAARRRLKKRRRTVTPPIWSAPRNRKNTPGPDTGATTTPKNDTKPRGGNQDQNTQAGPRKTNTRWERIRSYARAKATSGGCFGGGATGPQTGSAGPTGTSGGPTAGGTRERRSPFENAAQAGPQAEWTVERVDYPGAQAKQWNPEALTTGQPALETGADPDATGPAPTNPPAPGASGPTQPTPAPAAGGTIQEKRTMLKPRGGPSGYSMAAEHATEITLDDSLDEAEGFAKDAFKTHDECGRLAKKAHALRQACIQLSEELATKHNLIGRLFQGALARFIESMDLVDRMAQEMEMSSLEAAEMAEALSNDLEDAYRPYTQATADAGLTTPSAPIHNRV